MFVVQKKRRQFRTIDAVIELFADSVRTGSMKPMTLLFKKGRYGRHGCLEGNYVEYRRYLEKIGENRKEVAITR